MEQDEEKDFSQYRNPRGEAGHAVVEGMNVSHYELTTWGLGFVRLRTDETILDIGCGGGRTVERLAALAPRGRVFGADHSEDCVRWAAQRNLAAVDEGRVRIVRAGVDALPFDDATFDSVFAIETVYFWPNLPQNFAEVARVTKPGGRFVIIHEAYASERFREENAGLVEQGMRILSPDEARDLLLGAGFRSVQIHTAEEKNWMCCLAAR